MGLREASQSELELEVTGRELLGGESRVREEGEEGAEMRKIEGLGQRYRSG